MRKKKDNINNSIFRDDKSWKILFVGSNNALYQQLEIYVQNIVFLDKFCQVQKLSDSLENYQNYLMEENINIIFLMINNINDHELNFIKNIKQKNGYFLPKIITIFSEESMNLRNQILADIHIFDYLEIENITLNILENKIITVLKSYQNEQQNFKKLNINQSPVVTKNDQDKFYHNIMNSLSIISLIKNSKLENFSPNLLWDKSTNIIYNDYQINHQNKSIYELCHLMMKNFEDGICIFSKVGKINFVNAQMEKFLGVKQEEIIGKTWLDFCEIYSDNQNNFLGECTEYWYQENYYFNSKNQNNLLRVYCYPMYDENVYMGSLLTFTKNVQKITPPKTGLKSGQHLQEITALVPGMVFQLGCDSQENYFMTFVSKAVNNIFEFTPAQVIEDVKIIFNLIDPRQLSEFYQTLKLSRQYLTQFHYDSQITTPSGKHKYIRINALPQKLTDKETTTVIWHGLIMDITIEKQREVALRDNALLQKTINSIMSKIRDSIDLPIIYDTATEEIRSIFNCDRVSIYQFNAEWGGEFIAENAKLGLSSIVGDVVKRVWNDTYLQIHEGGKSS